MATTAGLGMKREGIANPLNAVRRRPVMIALCCQLAAGLAAQVADKALFGAFDISLPFYPLLALHGLLAAALGHLLKLPRWWLPLNLTLPVAAGVFLSFDVPSWFYLGAFVALAVVFWNSSSDRVPLYLTNTISCEEILKLIPNDRPVRFIDLGSGLGGLLVCLAERRPDSSFVGVESAPLLYVLAWLRTRFFPRPNLTLRYRNFWKEDLSDFDVVYCFLSDAPMNDLLTKARGELRPGALLISNTFDATDCPAKHTVVVGDRRHSRLHLWNAPIAA